MSVIEKVPHFGIEDVGKYYSKRFYCTNCGHSACEEVKKGVIANGTKEECPECGCHTYNG